MGTPTFVMPLYADSPTVLGYLAKAVAGIRAQSDPDWRLVIVDDASPHPAARGFLFDEVVAADDRIAALVRDTNRGQGVCRNVGVAWAAERGSPFVLFNDADDVSHPERLRTVGSILETEPATDFVYSTFVPIDEDDEVLPADEVPAAIAAILASHRDPLEGTGTWRRMGVEVGYTTLTSTVATRTGLARRCPFPAYRTSEDTHTWFRMLATSTGVRHKPAIPTLYRLPRSKRASSIRTRIGDAYCLEKAVIDSRGFFEAIAIALGRGELDEHEVDGLKAAFFRLEASIIDGEGDLAVARWLRRKAARFERSSTLGTPR